MSDSILDTLGRKYIGDPADVGLPPHVYSAAPTFEEEELDQKMMRKRFFVASILGEKHDSVGLEIAERTAPLMNAMRLIFIVVSAACLLTHLGDMKDLAFGALGAAKAVHSAAAPADPLAGLGIPGH